MQTNVQQLHPQLSHHLSMVVLRVSEHPDGHQQNVDLPQAMLATVNLPQSKLFESDDADKEQDEMDQSHTNQKHLLTSVDQMSECYLRQSKGCVPGFQI